MGMGRGTWWERGNKRRGREEQKTTKQTIGAEAAVDEEDEEDESIGSGTRTDEEEEEVVADDAAAEALGVVDEIVAPGKSFSPSESEFKIWPSMCNDCRILPKSIDSIDIWLRLPKKSQKTLKSRKMRI